MFQPPLSAAALSGRKNVLDCPLDFVCAIALCLWLTLRVMMKGKHKIHKEMSQF